MTKQTGNTRQKPLKNITAGGVSSAIWENEISINGNKKTVLKATLQRRFMDKDGTWKSSNSFNRNEISIARKIISSIYPKSKNNILKSKYFFLTRYFGKRK